MKVFSAMILCLVLGSFNPANAQFMTDHRQMNRWLQQMALTSPEVLSLDSDSRKSVACLAMNIYHEARGSIMKEKLAVAHVTINRTHNKVYDSDICNTIFQYSMHGNIKRPQFSWTTKNPRPARESDTWESIQHMAMMVYQGLLPDPTHGAVYFHSAKLRPAWANHETGVYYIGSSRFFFMPFKS